MCVIIVKPAGVKIPNNNIINAANIANPNGCGLISPSVFYKGMCLHSLKYNLKQISINEPCIIHFRLATHGSIKQANCHPFNRGEVWFAHNGILSIRPQGDMTDSETAFQNIIYPVIEKYGYGSEQMNRTIQRIIGYSKFAFLKGGNIKMYGDFILGKDGCYYSNLRFISYMG